MHIIDTIELELELVLVLVLALACSNLFSLFY